MKVLLCIVAALALASAVKYEMEYLDVNDEVALESAFQAWADHFGKEYTRFGHRDVALENFKLNVLKIQTHNAVHAAGKSRHWLRMNHFGDLSVEQYRERVLAKPRHFDMPMEKIKSEYTAPTPWTPAPLNPKNQWPWDWRNLKAVTPVKDQGQCGSCWAFSTTGSMETAIYNATGTLTSLSEQQLVDCSDSYGNQGCDGGDMGQAMQYAIDTKYLDTEDAYPYNAWDGKCVAKPSNTGRIYWYINITSGSDIGLENAANLGSVSVAIDASSDDFQFYGGGLYEEAGCSQTDLDHGVLVVGYNYITFNAKDKVPYWIVKNSWNTDWGDNGYIMMRKAESATDDWRNMCGICTQATQPYAFPPPPPPPTA
jgi:cathepsin L